MLKHLTDDLHLVTKKGKKGKFFYYDTPPSETELFDEEGSE